VIRNSETVNHQVDGWTVVLRSKADGHRFIAWGQDVPILSSAMFRTKREAQVLARHLRKCGMRGEVRRCSLEIRS
jgi:hypothetical protein